MGVRGDDVASRIIRIRIMLEFSVGRVRKVVPADLGSGQGSRFDCINNELFNWYLKYEDIHLYTSIAAETTCLRLIVLFV